MQTELADNGIRLTFESRDEAKAFFDQAKAQAGIFLQLPDPLQFRDRRDITATAPDFEFSFAAEVVQAFPAAGSWGTGFQLLDWDEKALEAAWAPSEASKKAATKNVDNEMGMSPQFRIKQMNPAEKFRLALKANRTERAILLRDTSPQVLMGLLSHPQIENKEVLELIKSPYVSSGVLERVAKNRQWMSHPEIPGMIAKNPKTPQPLAIKLLDSLRTPDLQKMAKSSGIREGLRKAALKAYMRRTGQRL